MSVGKRLSRREIEHNWGNSYQTEDKKSTLQHQYSPWDRIPRSLELILIAGFPVVVRDKKRGPGKAPDSAVI